MGSKATKATAVYFTTKDHYLSLLPGDVERQQFAISRWVVRATVSFVSKWWQELQKKNFELAFPTNSTTHANISWKVDLLKGQASRRWHQTICRAKLINTRDVTAESVWDHWSDNPNSKHIATFTMNTSFDQKDILKNLRDLWRQDARSKMRGSVRVDTHPVAHTSCMLATRISHSHSQTCWRAVVTSEPQINSRAL